MQISGVDSTQIRNGRFPILEMFHCTVQAEILALWMRLWIHETVFSGPIKQVCNTFTPQIKGILYATNVM